MYKNIIIIDYTVVYLTDYNHIFHRMCDDFSRVLLSQARQLSSFSSNVDNVYKERVWHPVTHGQIPEGHS